MKRLSLIFSAMLAAALFAAPVVQSQTPAPDRVAATAASPMLWFVEISGDKDAFRQAAAKAGIEFEERYAFDTLWQGMSVRASASHAGALGALDGVVAVYPVETITPHQVEGGSPDLFTAIQMSGANIAQANGFDGSGVKVGVIDSGIDYDHPDLGGCFGPGCRVAAGFDFVGDFYAAGLAAPTPDPLPDDCQGPQNTIPGVPQAAGHGTHVAGIIGADGHPVSGALGVAPGVTFGAYRVFGCSGGTSADIMLAAMEMAYADGMDVVNMSIGSSHQWPQYPTAVAADALVDRGVVVVTSFGNSGATGLYSGGAPGVGENVIAVGAVDNSHARARFFTVSPDNGMVPFNQASDAPNAPTSGSALLARTGTTASTADACNGSPILDDLTGKVALVRRGSCTFHEKSLNAQMAGAIGVVIYNNAAGLQSITVAGVPAISIPVVSITAGAGAVLDSRIAAGPTTLTWQAGEVLVPQGNGGLSSSFSSYGLAPDLSFKPDITAPGGGIRSTYAMGFQAYAVLSGTSMSSPHVAGTVAQLLQAEPGLTPAQVRTRLQNTAQPILWWGNPGLGFLDNTFRQGAGLVRIDRALAATTAVTPSKVALGESSDNLKFKLDVHNDGDHAVTYSVHHEPALSTAPLPHSVNGSLGPFQFGFFAGFAALEFDDTITVDAGSSARLHVDVSPSGPDLGQYGGYLVFTPDDGGDVVRVPYGGFQGDYQSLQVLQPASNFAFPWLAQLSGGFFSNRPAGATYTMVGDDIPFFLFHLAHQSRKLEFTVRAVGANNANWHSFLELDHFRRNGGDDPATLTDSFYSVGWDGFTLNPSGKQLFMVPDGQYQVTIRAQRALGNPSQDETWVSPVFTIDRP